MNKLQEIIRIILEAPISSDEKIQLIANVNQTASEEALNQAISDVASYLDASANKSDEEAKVLDKHRDTLAQIDQELEAVRQAPVQNFIPNPQS